MAQDYPTPISRERLIKIFDENHWHYYIDNEGDIGGIWEDNQFWFSFKGENDEILQIQGRWFLPLNMERTETARKVVARWNEETFWPRAYVRVDDEGIGRVYGDVTIDYEAGATDDQLMQHAICAINTTRALFGKIAKEINF